MENKTCLWCAHPCSYYYDTIAPECSRILDTEAIELRQYIAENCPTYEVK